MITILRQVTLTLHHSNKKLIGVNDEGTTSSIFPSHPDVKLKAIVML